MAPAFGRRRSALKNKSRAYCPFKVTRVLATTDERLNNVTKQPERVDKHNRADLVQRFPFNPQGTFSPPRTMDLSYFIKPEKPWLDMTRYNSFVLQSVVTEVKYVVGDFLYIANDTAVGQQIGTAENLKQLGYWVAKILEIRHQTRTIHNELVASNHMDIINVISVVAKANVRQEGELDEHKVKRGLYWRQAFDYLTSQLSSAELPNTCPAESTAQLGSREAPLPTPQPILPALGESEKKANMLSVEGDSVPTKHTRHNALGHRSPRTENYRSRRRRRRQRRKIIVPTTPSPLSTHSPASTEHKLLAHLQSVLEAACYEFGKRTMPDTLRRHGWDCAEALELNRCVKELQQWSFLGVNPANKPPDELFRSIADIRHTAVHRRRVSLHVVRQFFTDAETLLLLFGDDVRRREIAMLRQEVRMVFAKTKQNHLAFHSTVSKSLRVIAIKRAHLRCVK
ncbi:ebs-bah-phd domain-containing protein [Metarhizium guizhouense ARSEF 977]|uniref:Ebs-bah-phd domain-containing protein n=1 Tax=Metarhizium guizhouense (strain ARSEF 977) TaxID=1276136 RepID=A0A0B4GTY7_METGA|nr:ebs-bah-phd domain-containing protein [Metarhizium guizhouense ARSEF 977]